MVLPRRILKITFLILCLGSVRICGALDTGQISGVVFEDTNGNGVKEPAEAVNVGVTVFLDLNDNGVLDGGEPSTVSDAGGAYSFTGLAAGDYVVRFIMPGGSVLTYPKKPFKLRGHWIDDDLGLTYGDVWGDGNQAYIGNYSGDGWVHIIDISDPANPVTLSHFVGDMASAHAVQALASTSPTPAPPLKPAPKPAPTGPFNHQPRAKVPAPTPAPASAAPKNTTPAASAKPSPRHVDNGSGNGSGSETEDIVTSNGIMFTSSNNGGGIFIVDVHDPANPVQLQHLVVGDSDSVHTLCVSGNYMYFADNRSPYFYIYDVSQFFQSPLPPLPSATLVVKQKINAGDAAVRVHEVTIRNGRLYVAVNTTESEEAAAAPTIINESEIWDVSTPVTPHFLTSYKSGFMTHTVWSSDDSKLSISAREPYPWQGAVGEVTIWDVQNLASPQKLATLNAIPLNFGDVTAHMPCTVVNGSEHLLYISWYWAGVTVFEISDPANPVLYGRFRTTQSTADFDGCWGVYPYLGPDKILASDITNGLFVLAHGTAGTHYINLADGQNYQSADFGIRNLPPVFAVSGGVTATPNPAVTGETVSFATSVTDPENAALTYTWDFGDTLTGSGATTTHAFAATGSYTVTVTASDGTNSVSKSVTVDVVAASVLDLRAKLFTLNFARSGKDACALAGTLPGLPANFATAGKTLSLNIGGLTANFVLDARGFGRNTQGTVTLRKSGALWVFSVQLGPGNFKGNWTDEGLANATHGTPANLTMNVRLGVGTQVFTTVAALKYYSVLNYWGHAN